MPTESLQQRSILCGRGRTHHFHGTMPLGIRTFFGGAVHYKTERGAYAVAEDTWFIVNAHQAYSIEFDLPTPLQSFVVFFPDGWACDVAHSLEEKPAHLLDNPIPAGRAVDFFETVVSRDNLVMPMLLGLRENCLSRQAEDGWLEERLRSLLATMLISQREHLRSAARLPSLRPATRHELYSRLCRGRDYIRAMALRSPALGEVASAARLSPYHFQRNFKAVFGESPHTFLTRCRLDHARWLLTRTALPTIEVAVAVGFESYSAFSRAYWRRFGQAPSAIRKN